MRLTTADLVVLSVLAYEGPMHGYELIKTLKQRHIENWTQVGIVKGESYLDNFTESRDQELVCLDGRSSRR